MRAIAVPEEMTDAILRDVCIRHLHCTSPITCKKYWTHSLAIKYLYTYILTNNNQTVSRHLSRDWRDCSLNWLVSHSFHLAWIWQRQLQVSLVCPRRAKKSMRIEQAHPKLRVPGPDIIINAERRALARSAYIFFASTTGSIDTLVADGRRRRRKS